MTADAWATALMVLGADEGLALARAQNLAALFWVRGKAAWDERMTLGLAAMLD
jgi:thiamine biosynthesis lipoprotein